MNDQNNVMMFEHFTAELQKEIIAIQGNKKVNGQ